MKKYVFIACAAVALFSAGWFSCLRYQSSTVDKLSGMYTNALESQSNALAGIGVLSNNLQWYSIRLERSSGLAETISERSYDLAEYIIRCVAETEKSRIAILKLRGIINEVATNGTN